MKNTSERITTRMNEETKQLLTRALALSGFNTLNSFIINAATQAAKKLIEQEHVIHLSQRDAMMFLQALDEPIEHNQRLLDAAATYKEYAENDFPTFKPTTGRKDTDS